MKNSDLAHVPEKKSQPPKEVPKELKDYWRDAYQLLTKTANASDKEARAFADAKVFAMHRSDLELVRTSA